MNKTTTALTVLIKKIDNAFDKIKATDSPIAQGVLIAVREEAISLLQKERENMEQCISIGLNYKGVGYFPDLLQAFKDNFTQYKITDNE